MKCMMTIRRPGSGLGLVWEFLGGRDFIQTPPSQVDGWDGEHEVGAACHAALNMYRTTRT